METNVTSVEVYNSEDGYRWRAKSANGEIVATGESHPSVANAKRAARDVFPEATVKMGEAE